MRRELREQVKHAQSQGEWFVPEDNPLLGLPDWLIVAGLCFLGIAALNAWAWWGADWDDDTPEGD